MSTVPVNSRTPLLVGATQRASSHSPGPADRPPNPTNLSTYRLSKRRRRSPPIQTIPAFITVTILLFVAFIAWDVSSIGNCYFAPLCKLLGEGGERVQDVWWRNAGAYAPWRSLGPGGGHRGLPRGCEINQVTLLHRHASRFPTTAVSQCLQGSLDKIANRQIRFPRHHPELAFLAKADFKMTDWHFDQLTNQGRKAAWRSGREMSALYHQLIVTGHGLFSRASGQSRVEETGGYWLEGFHGEVFKIKSPAELPRANVTIPEGETANNTLSVHTCPAFENRDEEPVEKLLKLLKPTVHRLNSILKPQPRLNVSDVVCLADMCPYDSQARGENTESWSRWCGIFTRDEWELLGHLKDAKRYYSVGQGSPYGATMGAGWVNELLARLTDSEVVDGTTTNRTLDADEAMFPRGGKHFFVDFTHDNEIITILNAMGLMKQQRPVALDGVPDKRTFIISEIVPFGSRIIFERIGCDLGNWEPDPESGLEPKAQARADDGSEDDGRKNYLRIFVNDVLEPMEHIACQQSGFVEHGMCEVESFIESQEWSRNEVDWGLCYEKHRKHRKHRT